MHQLSAQFDLTQRYRHELAVSDFTVRYEDLVRHPMEETRRLLDYLELPFEPACLAFHENRRYSATPSYAQVTEQLNERPIDRHQHYMKDLERFIPRLARLIAAWSGDNSY